MASFDDGKDEGALRTIGEVGDALGIKAHVLRYWEGQFPMLQPLKRSGGRRYYRSEDIALVREIDRLVNREGYTLRGAKAALKEFGPGDRPVRQETAKEISGGSPGEGGASPAVPQETLDKLRAIRARLADALQA
ncbi:MerR family transcriptional regulator [Tsuneonella sp. HG249]